MSTYQAVELVEDTDDGYIRGESWMLHVAQAICGNVSHAIKTNNLRRCTPLLGIKESHTGSGPPAWGGGAPKLALYRNVSLDKPVGTGRYRVSGSHEVIFGRTMNP